MADATVTRTASSAKTRTGFGLPRINSRAVVMTLYLVFLMLPIYWLLNMSLKTNGEIQSGLTLWPQTFTLQNYVTILTDPSWYMGLCQHADLCGAEHGYQPRRGAACRLCFSRYHFMGDKHLFFWLLTNRMAPPAVFALPFFQLYSSVGLF